VGPTSTSLLVTCWLEIKTSVEATLRKEWLWQVVGYALLDLHDDLGIERVGIWSSRHGRLLAWPLEEVLCTLAGSKVDITHVRADFVMALDQARSR
jgi:hypothetical protein